MKWPVKFLPVEIACVLAAAVLWGTTGTIRGLLPAEWASVTVSAYRVLLGAVTLWMICLIGSVPLAPLFKLALWRVAAAGAAMAGYNLFFFFGVTHAGVGVGTAVALGSGPFWVLAMEWLIGRKRPSTRSALGQAAAISGLALLAGGNTAGQSTVLGYGAAALAGLSYGTYVYLTRGFPDETPSSLAAAATFSVSSLLLFPQLFQLPPDGLERSAVLLLLFLGVMATGIAYALFTFGLKKISASTAVTLVLAEPLTAWVLATVALNEEINVLKCLGAGLLLCGIRLVSRQPRTESRRAVPENSADRQG
ncbi:MAG TPA: DMT family transporter [Patescibacteria group bacterium]|nr:DMT family transporter [Patescibacteria group bacterium]